MLTQKSIVVLPFENISSDRENEYFADGVTEEIINALSKIEGLKVTARTSSFAYKNNPKDIRIIGNELGVSTALEGSIRKSGNRIRISTQLIKTDNGFQVWSESFDRDLIDIFELQDEISLLIADKIRENFGHLEIHEHLVTAQTNNVDAYSYFLKGRYHQLRWNFNGFDIAIEAYEQSVSLDPTFYKPYFGLLQCYGLKASWGAMDKGLGMEKANQYLKEGLKISNQTTEAHFALATKSLWVDWKPYEALGHHTHALAINPNDSEVLESAAEAHIALGQFDDASSYIKKALDVNPLSANHLFTLGNIYYLQRDFSNALIWLNKSLEIDPSWELSLQVSALCYIFMKDRRGLDDLMVRHPELTEGYLFPHLYDAMHMGVPINSVALPESNDVYFPWSLWKLIYAGKTEQAFQQLLSGIEAKQGQYLNFLHEPINQPITTSTKYKSRIPSVFDDPIQAAGQHDSGKSNALIPVEDQQQYMGKLERLMHEEQLYMSGNLTLRSLAQSVDLHANKLSWLINEVIGKNFNEYINGLRVEAFKKKAMEPTYSHYSLLGIAYECGFTSKSVFNDFFKKSEGMPPSAWLKKQKSR